MTVFLAPHFTNNVDQIFSASELDQLGRLVALVDQMSYREMPAHTCAGGFYSGAPKYWKVAPGDNLPDIRIWKGFVRYRTGMTTLTINGQGEGAVKFYLLVNGQNKLLWQPTGAFSENLAFSGYADGQIIPVEVRAYNTSATGDYWIDSVYGSPLTYTASTWPGLPTFSTLLDAGDLNKLGAAATWLYNKIVSVPIVPQRGLMYQVGPYQDKENHITGYTLYHGTLQRHYPDDRWYMSGGFINPNVPDMVFQILFGNTVKWEVPIPAGGYTPLFYNELFDSVGLYGRQHVTLQAIVRKANPDRNAWVRTWFNLYGFGTGQTSTTHYAYSTVKADYVAGNSLTGEALAAQLNNYAATLQTVYNRVQATTTIFNRGYASPYWFGQPDEVGWSRAPLVFARRGAQLVAGGKGATLSWGPVSIPTVDGKTQEWNWKAAQNTTLVDPDNNGGGTTYLDTIDNFKRGVLGFMTGKEATYLEELL